jgi:hypothetical protein
MLHEYAQRPSHHLSFSLLGISQPGLHIDLKFSVANVLVN